MIAFQQHVDPLHDKAIVVVGKGDNTLHPEHIRAMLLGNRLDPGKKPLRIKRLVAEQRETRDMIIMMVMMMMFQEFGFDLQHPIQIEGIAREDVFQRYLAALAAVDDRCRIDPANALLDIRKLIVGHQVGLVEKHNIGKGQLFLRFVRLVDLVEQVLGIDDGDDCIKAGLGLHIVVDEEGLGDRCGIGQIPWSRSGWHRNGFAVSSSPSMMRMRSPRTVQQMQPLFISKTSSSESTTRSLSMPDFAELIDDDGIALAMVFGEDAIEQGCFACTKVSGQHGYGCFLQ